MGPLDLDTTEDALLLDQMTVEHSYLDLLEMFGYAGPSSSAVPVDEQPVVVTEDPESFIFGFRCQYDICCVLYGLAHLQIVGELAL